MAQSSVEDMIQQIYQQEPALANTALDLVMCKPEYSKKLQKLSHCPAAAKAFLEQFLKSSPARQEVLPQLHTQLIDEKKDIEDMRRTWEEVTGSEVVEVDGDYWHLVSDKMDWAAKNLLPSAGAFLGAGVHFKCEAAAAATGWPFPPVPVLPKEVKEILIKAKADPHLQNSTWAMRGGTILTVGCLGYEFYSSVRKYYHHQIDGYELAENWTTSIVSMAASFAGACSGATLLTGAGPAGIAFGTLVGAYLAGSVSRTVIHKLFMTCFGDNRSRSLHSAYVELGLEPSADNKKVRQTYLALAKESHPDKAAGSHEKFIRINCAYELIRAARLSG